jgi:hypothetical protein
MTTHKSIEAIRAATACANDNPPRSIADMEAQWEACKGKAKAEGVKTPAIHCAAKIAGVTNSATPPPLPGSKEALEARITKLEKDLAAAKAAPTPAVASRIIETAARAAVAQLSAERRATRESDTPHLDRFNSLSGAMASAYYKEHSTAIRAEQTEAVLHSQKKA